MINLQIVFYVVLFISVPYTLQEDVQSYGTQLSYVYLVSNSIYKSLGRNKSHFYGELCKRQKFVTVLMKTVSIPNLEVKVWTQKSYFPQGNHLYFLIQPVITRQIPLEIMYV